jgi:hypothetical protein
MLFCGTRSSLAVCDRQLWIRLAAGWSAAIRERVPEKPFHGRLLGGTVGVGVPGLWRLSRQIGQVQHIPTKVYPPSTPKEPRAYTNWRTCFAHISA